jgi:LPS sulfotransferase NodH
LQQSNFVIVAQPRSGSYHLCSLLDSASDVICHGEVFKKERIEISPWHANRLGVGKSLLGPAKSSLGIGESSISKRDADPLDFLHKLRGLDPDKIFGFKAFPTHLTQRKELHSNVLMSPHWRKVFLLRNPLERYASILRAKATKVWALQSNGRKIKNTTLEMPVIFEKDSFEKHMETHDWFHRMRDSVEGTGPNICIDIFYDELNDRRKISELLSFICSSHSPENLTSRYRKQFNIPFAQGFANWVEFKAYLRESGLSHHIPPS